MGLTFLLKERVPDNFYGIRDFPYLKLGIQDFKAKSRRDLGLKVCAVGGMPKMTFGIPGLHEIWGRDYGIEEPYWGPSMESGGLQLVLVSVPKKPWEASVPVKCLSRLLT